MMEMLYELRNHSGFCRVFDFYADAKIELESLIRCGMFEDGDLYINTVVTE